MKKLNVVCVYKTGGEYTPEHVAVLMNGFHKHLTVPYRFICLSDKVLHFCKTIPLRHKWKGWWSKIELFRPRIFKGPVFYCDLDTIITGSIDDMVLGHRFTTLHHFLEPKILSSAVMAWDADLSIIYKSFFVNSDRQMKIARTPMNWGDQGVIRQKAPIKPKFFQTRFPGRIVSYKLHVAKEGLSKDVSLVCFHGHPRPWMTDLWQH